ncbi:MAG: hypothetical protein BWY32_03774 [bacterium ADurb.Bin243]|nr:MAG: hypothetical protein BWY32_03774 [bacterium ADurb.Bin243]
MTRTWLASRAKHHLGWLWFKYWNLKKAKVVTLRVIGSVTKPNVKGWLAPESGFLTPTREPSHVNAIA